MKNENTLALVQESCHVAQLKNLHCMCAVALGVLNTQDKSQV